MEGKCPSGPTVGKAAVGERFSVVYSVNGIIEE